MDDADRISADVELDLDRSGAPAVAQRLVDIVLVPVVVERVALLSMIRRNSTLSMLELIGVTTRVTPREIDVDRVKRLVTRRGAAMTLPSL